jgi:elongation factor G
MKHLENVRNIGIIAHIDAGKTTTTERILFLAGRIHRMGDVDDGNTTTDYMDQERERGITIVSAAITFDWKGFRVNLIDTPGHVDFTAEVERSLRVLDGVVIVLCGVAGVQPQTETVWRQANRYGVPRLIYINKLDRLGANFDNVVEKVKHRLGAIPAVLHVPIGIEDKFIGVCDVIENQAYTWPIGEDGSDYTVSPVPEDLKDRVALARQELIETVAESDDEATEIFIETGTLDNDQLKQFIRKGTVSRKIIPVLGGSSYKHRGIQPLLDAVTSYLPSPLDRPIVIGHNPKDGSQIICKPDDDEPLAALVFKIVTDNYLGSMAFVRVYSGKLNANSYCLNANTGKKERVMRCLHLFADKREDVSEISAGDIGGVLGLKESQTGHTLYDEGRPVALEQMDFPDTVISMAIEPMTKADEGKIHQALKKYAMEDPTFKVRYDEEAGQIIISGMGELHLEVMIERVRRDEGLQIRIGKPQVQYKETIGSTVTCRGTQIKQTGGKGQYGDVLLKVSPGERNSGLTWDNHSNAQELPERFIKAIAQGLKDAMETGPLLSFPVVDVHVDIMGGSYHEVDSNDISFRIAAGKGLKEAIRQGNPQLLEPIMKLEVTTPEDYLGDVLGQLNKRRCKIESMEKQGNLQLIEAKAPLAEMFGYATDLRSVTQGRGDHSMEFSHYEITPPAIRDEIIEKVKGIAF